MGASLFRPQRLLKLILLAAAIAAAVWWVGYIPYDPLAIYRPIPATATLAGRHLRLPARWHDLLANPLALAVMRTAGVDPAEAEELVTDEESRAWFEKLAGREGTLAYLPGRYGARPAWMAVSHLGGQSQRLRWQLALFRLAGFERLKQFPGRSVWRVDTPDLDPRQHLVIAFGEGVLMACLSEDPLAIRHVLAAYDGNQQRLLDEEPEFARLAAEDDRRVPDRFWIRAGRGTVAADAAGVAVEIPVLRGDSISLVASTAGLAAVPEDRPDTVGLEALARLLGNAPCAAALVQREALLALLDQPDLQHDVRYALRMVADIATGRVAVVAMEGDMGGRLAWGVMSRLGLSGLRVPTVLLATPAPDEAAAQAAIQRVLDLSNARYKAAFVLQPVAAPPATLYALESAGGNEWVDELAKSDRPAYAVLDGWLLASSNLAALQKLAQAAAARRGHATGAPAWARPLGGAAAVQLWLDLVRSGQVARDAIATWSMAQMFLDGGNSRAARERLNEVRTWIDAFAPFGLAQAELARRGERTALALDLGLSGAPGSARMPAP